MILKPFIVTAHCIKTEKYPEVHYEVYNANAHSKQEAVGLIYEKFYQRYPSPPYQKHRIIAHELNLKVHEDGLVLFKELGND